MTFDCFFSDEDFENDESFEAGFSQMNETDFLLFTQNSNKDQHQKLPSHSTPSGAKTHPQASKSNHCTDDATVFEAKFDPQMSRQNGYREIIDADESFEAKLSQMSDFEFGQADSDSESAICTPNKLSRLNTKPDTSKTPVLSSKLQKKLNLQ